MVFDCVCTNEIRSTLLVSSPRPRCLKPSSTDPPNGSTSPPVSAGSIGDNHKGGWCSCCPLKAALSQTMRTFDLHPMQGKRSTMAIGIHPGIMKTELSGNLSKSTPRDRFCEPEEAAECVLDAIGKLGEDQRGRVWDWTGSEVILWLIRQSVTSWTHTLLLRKEDKM